MWRPIIIGSEDYGLLPSKLPLQGEDNGAISQKMPSQVHGLGLVGSQLSGTLGTEKHLMKGLLEADATGF